jgi:hypothetical protein
VRIDGHAGGLGAIHHRPFPMASGEMLAVYRKPNVFQHSTGYARDRLP